MKPLIFSTSPQRHPLYIAAETACVKASEGSKICSLSSRSVCLPETYHLHVCKGLTVPHNNVNRTGELRAVFGSPRRGGSANPGSQ